MKKCCRCKEEKSLTEFCKDRSQKDGLSTRCKKCRLELNEVWKSKNKDKESDRKKRYRDKNKDRYSEWIDEWNKANPHKRKEYDAKYEKMTRKRAYEYKGGKCEDCGAIPFESSLRFEFHHIDPSTKGSHWGGIKRRNWEIQKEELDKCVLLCKPCHMKRHTDFNRGLRPTL